MQVTQRPSPGRIAAAVAILLSLSSGVSWAQNAPQPNPSDADAPKAASDSGDQPVVLSPFEVSTTEDTGYRAQNTLAGSRISTQLSDLASPISVVTKDFLNDTGAVEVNKVLTYQAGTEGTLDFKQNSPQLGRTTDNATQDPNAATRGRGLAAFDITRDYFYSLSLGNPVFSTQGVGQSVGFDAYNLDNVTIVRGADSILAGLGSPAGIINFAPQLALLTHDSTAVSYRFGSYGDQRAVLNTNQVLKAGQLAIRLAGVWNDYRFEQKPAFDRDKRYYAALTWKPFRKTTIHASYENVNVDQHRPNTLTPEDDITQWIQLGKPTSPAPGVSAPNLGGAVNGGANLFVDSTGKILYAYDNSSQFAFYQTNLTNIPLWQPSRFSNDQYGDWHKLNTSGTFQNMKLDTQQLSIDQEVLPGLTVNLAWLHEIASDHQVNTVRPDFVLDSVDVNQKLPDGSANPHFGETYMFFSGLDNFNQLYSTNVVTRGSATYDLNLTKYNKWLGRFVFTGLMEYRKTKGDFLDYNSQGAGSSPAIGGGPGVITYTGGTAANGYKMTSTAISPALVQNAPFLHPDGSITNNYTTVKGFKEEYKAITKLDTSALVVQGYLVDNLLVGTFGVRKDKDQQGYAQDNSNPLPDDKFSSGPLSVSEATTRTYGAVLHGPKLGAVDLSWLSLGYSQSENFVPNAGSIDLEGHAVSNPTGTSKDWSVSADLLGGKLNVKVDFYKTLAANSPAASVNFPLVQWSLPYYIVGFGTGANPDPSSAPIADIAKRAGVSDFKSLLGASVTTGNPALANAYAADTEAKGMELELTYNVTRNWRVFGTVTKQEAKQTNIAKPLTALIAKEVEYWKSIGIWDSPLTTTYEWGGTPRTVQDIYNIDILPAEVAYLSADGQPSQQLHKWKATLVTNYTFDHGVLNNFGVGGGLRWLDKTVIGNPAVLGDVNGVQQVVGLDLAHPYTTPAQTSVQLWLTYAMKLRDKYTLSFRLEGDNLESSGGYRAIAANGNGSHSVYSIVPPRTFYFTTELKF